MNVLDEDYADDMAVMDNGNGGLQEYTNLLSSSSKYAGLKINASKTKFMAVSKNTSQRPYSEECTLNITVDGFPAE